tara:strand:- start:1954 stop:2280 length:327 start_codon:yes stop_codon:yes gene_type:complete
LQIVPLARVLEHVPMAPFVGATDASYGPPVVLKYHTTGGVSTPTEHVSELDAVKPTSHSGSQLASCATSAQFPTPPFSGAVCNSQFSRHVVVVVSAPSPSHTVGPDRE